VFRGVCPNYPLIVCANRDERPTRPTLDPTDRYGGVYAPLDLVHGGTWIGVNRHGILAALTNRFPSPRFHGRRSRGFVVSEALASRDSFETAACMLRRGPGVYNGYQLFVDDGRDAAVIWNDTAQVMVRWLDSGTWVFTGDDEEPGVSRRAEVVADRLRAGTRFEDWNWLMSLLQIHMPEPGDGTCVHGPGINMESVFSMIIRLPGKRDRWQILWRAKRPCEDGDWTRVDIPIDRP
jgi:hypothetical protein